MDTFKNNFSWSKSRDGLFNTCLRGYYFNYYAYWNGWKEYAPRDVRVLYIMKKLISRSMWVGGVVHKQAEIIVKNMKLGHTTSPNQALQSLEKLMMDTWKASENRRYMNDPKNKPGILEHFYNIPLSSDQFSIELSKAKFCLENFFESKAYQDLSNMDPQYILEVEEFRSFNLDDITVSLKLDLAIRNDFGIEIIDWKTGKNFERGTADLQLAVYAMYASQNWLLPFDSIRLRQVNLQHGEETFKPVDENIVEWAKGHIQSNTAEMHKYLLDVEENIPVDQSYFSMRPDERYCGWCNFMGKCNRVPVGTGLVDEENFLFD